MAIRYILSKVYRDDYTRNEKAVELFLKVIAGIAGFITLKFALDRAKASIESAKAQTQAVKAQNEQIELSRNAQLNEVLKNAIDHIANADDSVILAGLFELHSLAMQYPDQYLEIVSNTMLGKLRIEISRLDQSESKKALCQGIIDIVFKNETYNKINKDISNFNLSEFNIDGCWFENTKVENTAFPPDLLGVTFKRINFSKRILEFEKLTFCSIFECQFFGTIVSDIQFTSCLIENPRNSEDFNISRCDFINPTFKGNFIGVNFKKCEFIKPDFQNGKLSDCGFYGSIFKEETIFDSYIFNCEFIAVCFEKTLFNSLVVGTKFAGITSEFFEPKAFDNLLNKKNDYTGIINFSSIKIEDNNLLEEFSLTYSRYLKRLFSVV